MSDKRRIYAKAIDQDGNEGEIGVFVIERDSEVVPMWECRLRLEMTADRMGAKIIGEIFTDYEPRTA